MSEIQKVMDELNATLSDIDANLDIGVTIRYSTAVRARAAIASAMAWMPNPTEYAGQDAAASEESAAENPEWAAYRDQGDVLIAHTMSNTQAQSHYWQQAMQQSMASPYPYQRGAHWTEALKLIGDEAMEESVKTPAQSSESI